MAKAAQFVRFQRSDDSLPDWIDGPFEYLQIHHGSIEAGTLDEAVITDLAALNQDGTWDAGPHGVKQDGYTDAVFYSDLIDNH